MSSLQKKHILQSSLLTQEKNLKLPKPKGVMEKAQIVTKHSKLQSPTYIHTQPLAELTLSRYTEIKYNMPHVTGRQQTWNKHIFETGMAMPL